MTFAELSAFCIHALTFFTAVETVLFSFCNLMKPAWFEILYAGSGEKILQNIYKKLLPFPTGACRLLLLFNDYSQRLCYRSSGSGILI